jgi:3-oxoacyl-[acyl-carrier protein] reductase
VGLLDGKSAIVTGSSRGIGYEIARIFLREGAKVVINSRREADVSRAVTELSSGLGSPESVLGVAANVAVYEDCERLVNKCVSAFGRVDILVNNAGISLVKPSLELTPQEWDDIIRTNLSGAFYMSKLAAEHMKSNGGCIVNISSIFGLGGVPKRAAYCSSKHGLIGLTQVLATEWATYGIRVNCVSPGYILTEMDIKDSSVGEYSQDDIRLRTPMNRYGSVAEVAEVVLFLCSDKASYITGANLTVDGGWSAYTGWDRLLRQIKGLS